MTGVVVIGAGGHALVVLATLRAAGHTVDGVYDDDPARWGTRLLGAPVVGGVDQARGLTGVRGVIAIGDNRVRRQLASALPLRWVSAVHPAAVVHESATIGAGTVVFAGAVVQPEAVIGAHAILNTACTVDHEARVADFGQIGPGAHLGGRVRVEEGAFVGIGASVIQGVTLGAWATVGAGAAVVSDIPVGVTAVGVPARVLG